MKDCPRRIALFALFLAVPAAAQVGEPLGPLGVTLRQGNVIRVENPALPLPVNIKFHNGGANDFVIVGHLAPDAPVILKIISDGAAVEPFRTLHFYLVVPKKNPDNTINLNQAGPISLLDPANPGPVQVEIKGLRFAGTPGAAPIVLDQLSFYVSYLRDLLGRFYVSPGTNPYNLFGNGVIDVQVPGARYVDAPIDPYNFLRTCGSAKSSWRWANLVNPGPNTPVQTGPGTGPNAGGGYVFELGLGVGVFAQAPKSISEFINVLLGLAPIDQLCKYDFNLDGKVNGDDIPGFIAAIF